MHRMRSGHLCFKRGVAACSLAILLAAFCVGLVSWIIALRSKPGDDEPGMLQHRAVLAASVYGYDAMNTCAMHSHAPRLRQKL